MTTLLDYQTAVQNLVQSLQAPIALIATATLNSFINTARRKVAADGECTRAKGTLALANGTETYNFSAIVLPAGFASVLTVRLAYLQTAAGPPPKYTQIDLRPYEWYTSFYQVTGESGTPVRAGQQGQGVNGTLFFNPVPNATFSVVLDCVALPTDLADAATAETAIPYPWSDAVPFYSAWLAMLNQQRAADADMMFARYDILMRRARSDATPTVLPDNQPGGVGAVMASQHLPLFGAGQAHRGTP